MEVVERYTGKTRRTVRRVGEVVQRRMCRTVTVVEVVERYTRKTCRDVSRTGEVVEWHKDW